jgi:hypothetical protein
VFFISLLINEDYIAWHVCGETRNAQESSVVKLGRKIELEDVECRLLIKCHKESVCGCVNGIVMSRVLLQGRTIFNSDEHLKSIMDSSSL